MLIVPTQDIAFAALKDGSFISNFTMGGGNNNADPEALMAFFKALRKYILECDKYQFATFSLVYLIEGKDIRDAMLSRAKEIKDEA